MRIKIVGEDNSKKPSINSNRNSKTTARTRAFYVQHLPAVVAVAVEIVVVAVEVANADVQGEDSASATED